MPPEQDDSISMEANNLEAGPSDSESIAVGTSQTVDVELLSRVFFIGGCAMSPPNLMGPSAPITTVERTFIIPEISRNEVTPYALYYEWLSGLGPRARYFGPEHPMTIELSSHYAVAEAIELIRAHLLSECRACIKCLPHGSYHRSLAGVMGMIQYVRDYSVFLTGGTFGGNLTATFLGSYWIAWQTTSLNCCNGSAVVNMRVSNASTFHSGTRFPFFGYLEGSVSLEEMYDRIREGNITIGIPGSILSDEPRMEGPWADKYQVFEWNVNLSFPGNPECCPQ